MPEEEPPHENLPFSKRSHREKQDTAHRVVLDPSSPSVRAIIRVVLVTLFLLFIAGYLEAVISALSGLFFLVVLSIFFAYLVEPIVRLIRGPFKRRSLDWLMPRAAAIVIAYLFVFSIVAIAISNIAPRVVEQAKEFGENLPAYGTAMRQRINEINQRFDSLRIPDNVQADLNKKVTELGTTITTEVGGFVLISATFVPWLILIPILAFFFLKAVNLIRLSVLRSFPAGRWRIRAESVLQDVNTTLAAYTRAQLISCFLIGVICTSGFYSLGLKYALLLGILAGIFEFVPLLGPAVVGLIVILTAVFSDNPWRGLYVMIFLVTLRVAQDYVMYPRIVRGGIHLHPLVIILSVLSGEQVAGIPGVFLSIPIVAVATVIYRHILEHQGRQSLLSAWIADESAEWEEPA
jgi:predicted PurR-regulated permease PerM